MAPRGAGQLMFLLGLALALATVSSAAEAAESRQLAGPGVVGVGVGVNLKLEVLLSLRVNLRQCKRAAAVTFTLEGVRNHVLPGELQCLPGTVTQVGRGLLHVQLGLLRFLVAEVKVRNEHGQVVKVKVKVGVNVVKGVRVCELELVEDVRRKLLKLVVGNKVRVVIELKRKLLGL